MTASNDTGALRQNDTLRRALHEARNEIMALRAEVDKLSAPPSTSPEPGAGPA
jgi:hypothetical protein